MARLALLRARAARSTYSLNVRRFLRGAGGRVAVEADVKGETARNPDEILAAGQASDVVGNGFDGAGSLPGAVSGEEVRLALEGPAEKRIELRNAGFGAPGVWVGLGCGERRRRVALEAIERLEQPRCIAGEVVEHAQVSGQRVQRDAILGLQLPQELDDLLPRIGHVFELGVQRVEQDYRDARWRARLLFEAVREQVWWRRFGRRRRGLRGCLGRGRRSQEQSAEPSGQPPQDAHSEGRGWTHLISPVLFHLT